MRMMNFLTSMLVVSALLPLAAGQGQGGGSVPTTPVFNEEGGSKQVVNPGNCHDNGDVKVCNNADSGGKATIDPKTANGGDAESTEVVTKTNFKGSVEGIETGDTVDVGSSNTASISGTGGNVHAQGGSTIAVTNTSAPGGSSINCTLPGGSTVVVGPGSNVTITT